MTLIRLFLLFLNLSLTILFKRILINKAYILLKRFHYLLFVILFSNTKANPVSVCPTTLGIELLTATPPCGVGAITF